LLENVDPGALIGDKAYDADSLIDTLNQRSITPVIPPKANRKTNAIAISCSIASAISSSASSTKIKHYRAIAPLRQTRSKFPRRCQLVEAIILLN